jgi:ABC-type multidrug transport system ATPase subunit
MQLGASGKTVFVSSHLLAEIQAACDSIVMIDHGGVVFGGTMVDLLNRNSPTIRAAAENETDTIRLIELATKAGYHIINERESRAFGSSSRSLRSIQTEIAKQTLVAAELYRIPGVGTAYVLTGPYDVIMRVEAADVDAVGKLVVTKIQAVKESPAP